MTNAAPIVLFAVAAVVLSGCATIPEDQCAKTDWYELGVKDGRAGHAADRLVKHREACARVKIEPDETRYLQGRKLGLADYCRVDRAIDAGLAGDEYEGVCDADFARLHRAGYAVWRAKKTVNDNLSAVSWREAEIKGDKASDSRKSELRSQVRELDRKRETLRQELFEAELELNRVRTERLVRGAAMPTAPARSAAPAAPPTPAPAPAAAGMANGKLVVGKTEIVLRHAYVFVAPDPLDRAALRPMLLMTQDAIPQAALARAGDLDALLATLPHYVLASRNDSKPPKVALTIWHPQLGARPVTQTDAGRNATARFDAYGDARIAGRIASPGNGARPYAAGKTVRLDVRFDAPLARRFR